MVRGRARSLCARKSRSIIASRCRRRGGKLNFGDRWDYAPAPEAHSYIKLKPKYQLFIGGKFVAPRSGKYFDSINPATEEETLAEIADANARDSRSCGKVGAPRLQQRLEQNVGTRARQISLPHCAFDSGKIARAGRARIDGRRQNDQGIARCRSSARRRALFLSRRLVRQASIRVSGTLAACARRGGPDYPLEFSVADGGVETCARACVRKHVRSQAGGDDFDHGDASRRDFSGSGIARRRREHCERLPAKPGARLSSIRTSTRSRSPARPKSESEFCARSPERKRN